MNPVNFTQSFVASVATGIALSQSVAPGGPGNLVLNGSLVSGGVAFLDATNLTPNIGAPAKARRVLITSTGNDTGITFTVVGTDRYGNAQSEVLTGGNATGVYTLNDFATVTKITASQGTASTVTAGTNGVGSSPWYVVDQHLTPFQVKLAANPTGTVNYTVEHTYDDPNWQSTPWNTTVEPNSNRPPLAWSHPTMQGQTAKSEGSYTDGPIEAIRLTTNSGTGSVQFYMTQAGIYRR